MKRFICLLFILTVFFNINLIAHPWKPDHYVVIDTDCGLDDFRAINLIIESSKIRVLAIITSNGATSAKDGYNKVKSLLRGNYHEGVLVGINPNPNQISHDCKIAHEFSWGDKVSQKEDNPKSYSEVLEQVLTNCPEKITFISLGGLNTINTYIENHPEKVDKIKEVLWTCDYNNIKGCFNYLLDTSSFNSLQNKKVGISYINGSSFGSYTDDLVNTISKYNTVLAKNLYSSLSNSDSPIAKQMYDESVVFYLLDKPIISVDSTLNSVGYVLKQGININSYYTDLINNNVQNQNQVLATFPMDTADYISDIRPMMDSTIKKYGKEEWISCVLTNELHRHLGVYSLIGAKMGIRAKEFFGAGVDELKVVSYAGSTPPFSCLNDGLQVSTGATVGHGLISVKENNKLPKAEFYYMGQKITISLKEEYRKKIASEIKDLSVIYGLDSNVYWDLVRILAIKYWANWDRHDIFEIEKE